MRFSRHRLAAISQNLSTSTPEQFGSAREMGKTARKKGDALEYAVRRIEETVLAHHPHFKDCDVTIESKKILVIQGVRHEIDVFVTINPRSNYPAQHIIECKNWKDPVGTAEIASLAIKREAVRASSASLITQAR